MRDFAYGELLSSDAHGAMCTLSTVGHAYTCCAAHSHVVNLLRVHLDQLILTVIYVCNGFCGDCLNPILHQKHRRTMRWLSMGTLGLKRVEKGSRVEKDSATTKRKWARHGASQERRYDKWAGMFSISDDALGEGVMRAI